MQAQKGAQTLIAADALMKGGVYVGIMAFVHSQLNCLKGGLTQSIKLSQIVRKFQKPYGFQTFASFLCGGTHLSQYCCLRGTGALLLCGSSHQGTAAHLSPLFMLCAQNYGPAVPRNKKPCSIKRGSEKLAQNFFFSFLFSFFLHQICVSHINF